MGSSSLYTFCLTIQDFFRIGSREWSEPSSHCHVSSVGTTAITSVGSWNQPQNVQKAVYEGALCLYNMDFLFKSVHPLYAKIVGQAA